MQPEEVLRYQAQMQPAACWLPLSFPFVAFFFFFFFDLVSVV